MTEVGDAMLEYAAEGWHVLPLFGPMYSPDYGKTGAPMFGCSCWARSECLSVAKHPRYDKSMGLEHGLMDATCDPTLIAKWVGRWTSLNVGVRTGDAFDVLDVDGEDGMRAFLDLGGGDWDGPMVETGRGLHAYMLPTGSGNRAGLLKGIDFRGQGGYVVAPPSTHANGTKYSWTSRTPLRFAPMWLVNLLQPQQDAGL